MYPYDLNGNSLDRIFVGSSEMSRAWEFMRLVVARCSFMFYVFDANVNLR